MRGDALALKVEPATMIKQLENAPLNGRTRTNAGTITARSNTLTLKVISCGRFKDFKNAVRPKPMVAAHLQPATAKDVNSLLRIVA